LAAQRLAAARLDVLYFWEVGTDCVNYYLPFLRLAPVQVSSWGWPITSGNPRVDYFLTSAGLDPPGAEQYYSETLVRLAGLPNFFVRPEPWRATLGRAQLGLAEDWHVYLCGQNPRKIHPDFDVLAGEILRSDRAGRLVLLESYRGAVTERLRRRLARTLPDVLERVVIVPRMTQSTYLNLAAAADVVLDTVHYGAGANSLYDTLAAGAPLVSWPGAFHRGRYTAAVYERLGLEGCLAGSAAEYVAMAQRVAGDRAWRGELSRQIAERREVLFEDEAAVREVEEFLVRAAKEARS
jgi:predicted O-linked N-acetylglucosamine transferase (SPINDLY family)